MDAAVEIVRLTQVNFYKGYQKARKVTVTGTGSMAVKGYLTDAATGLPLRGAMVSFALDGAAVVKATVTKPDVVKKTGPKGGFNLKTLPAGVYDVTCTKNGFAGQSASVAVSDGEKAVMEIQLPKPNH